eukprot:CAMPEP_0170545434 /NCGR_PEP_ID=MMETSP0211-20121228/3822_1 /TAXON_ID=311385 /ORGANISM="Pseudokeronopsis sp., Strain OXSARD2" /LENGTH=72 /DNA_ID=CAMNT_0010849333 /DNA_START=545 /DNA_END=763 /DNA_ORIENTATION=-
MMMVPSFIILSIFFCFYTWVTEAFLNQVGIWYQEKKKQWKIEEDRKSFVKKKTKDLYERKESKFKRTGFAFS